MNRPKIEDCTCEITSYELDGSETKQKVTDLKKYSFNLERYCDQLENEVTDCYEKCPFKEECQADDTMESHCVKASNWKRLVLENG